jgi:arylsulfatase A-like enzyme/tetratricopeptide (TPR) repeat protein
MGSSEGVPESRLWKTSPWLVLFAIVVGTGGCRSNLGPEDTRSVVLISIDTCRADRLGCYGHPSAATPNVDAVARDGVTFLLARTTNPITLPAHCSMMTGLIPPQHGVHDNRTYRLAASNVTLAEIMRDNGYSTAAFVGAFPLDSIMGLDQGFDVYDDHYTMGGAGRVANERKAMEVSTSAIEWLQNNHEDPFFLFVHYFDPHAPYEPPEPFASRHAGDPYLGEIAYTDHAIGRVIDELKRLDLYDSSLIVITADHGESLGEHEELTHAFFVYNSTMRVPLIIKAPGCVAGREVTEPTSVTDIAPTVLAALGMEARDAQRGMDLAEHLWGAGATSPERPLYGESVVPTVFGCNPLRGVVQGKWHYIWSKNPELYDLSRDPGEQHDMIDREAERAAVLHDALISMLQSPTPADEPGQPVEPEALERLESLGYVGSGTMPNRIGIDPSAVDPKDFVGDYVRLARAKALRYEGKLQEANAICREILERNPDSLWANNIAGLVAYDERRLRDARDYFSKVLTILDTLQRSAHSGSTRRFDFEIAEAHDHLGRVLELAGDTAAALQHLERAVDLQPDVAVFQNNLGSALVNLDRPDDALWHLEQAVRLRPSYASAHKNLGIALLDRREFGRAKVQFETAVRLTPSYVAAHYGLGHSLAYLDDFEGAAKQFARVLELDPEHDKARADLDNATAILVQLGRGAD